MSDSSYIKSKLDSIDTTVEELRADSVELKQKAAQTETILAQWSVNIERFWAIHMPKLESSIDRLADSIEHLDNRIHDVEQRHDDRIRAVEVEQSAIKVRVGLWGGIAGIAALAWHTLKELF